MRSVGVAALAGQRVGGVQQHLVDQLDAGHALQHREHLAGLHGPAERPARAVRRRRSAGRGAGTGRRAPAARTRSVSTPRKACTVATTVTPW